MAATFATLLLRLCPPALLRLPPAVLDLRLPDFPGDVDADSTANEAEACAIAADMSNTGIRG